jgi:hypothetical protein
MDTSAAQTPERFGGRRTIPILPPDGTGFQQRMSPLLHEKAFVY